MRVAKRDTPPDRSIKTAAPKLASRTASGNLVAEITPVLLAGALTVRNAKPKSGPRPTTRTALRAAGLWAVRLAPCR